MIIILDITYKIAYNLIEENELQVAIPERRKNDGFL